MYIKIFVWVNWWLNKLMREIFLNKNWVHIWVKLSCGVCKTRKRVEKKKKKRQGRQRGERSFHILILLPPSRIPCPFTCMRSIFQLLISFNLYCLLQLQKLCLIEQEQSNEIHIAYITLEKC